MLNTLQVGAVYSLPSILLAGEGSVYWTRRTTAVVETGVADAGSTTVLWLREADTAVCWTSYEVDVDGRISHWRGCDWQPARCCAIVASLIETSPTSAVYANTSLHTRCHWVG